jgi:tRNA G26 N,N-dimethylase Trm1
MALRSIEPLTEMRIRNLHGSKVRQARKAGNPIEPILQYVSTVDSKVILVTDREGL